MQLKGKNNPQEHTQDPPSCAAKHQLFPQSLPLDCANLCNRLQAQFKQSSSKELSRGNISYLLLAKSLHL